MKKKVSVAQKPDYLELGVCPKNNFLSFLADWGFEIVIGSIVLALLGLVAIPLAIGMVEYLDWLYFWRLI